MSLIGRIPLKLAIGLLLARECRCGNRIIAKAGDVITAQMLDGLNDKVLDQMVSVLSEGLDQETIDTNIENQHQSEVKNLYKDSREFPADFTLFMEGDYSSDIYILMDGEVEIVKDFQVIARISERGTFIGEMAVLRGCPRFADVRTACSTKLLRFNGDNLIESAKKRPEVLSRMCYSLAKKLSLTDKNYSKCMGHAVTTGLFSDYFESLMRHEQPEDSRYIQGEINLEVGDVLFEQNDRSTDMFILISGRVDVYINENHVAEIEQAGQVIGEMSGLLCKPRAATVRAKTNCRLFCVPGGQLKQFVLHHPKLVLQMCQNLAERIANTTDNYINLISNSG